VARREAFVARVSPPRNDVANSEYNEPRSANVAQAFANASRAERRGWSRAAAPSYNATRSAHASFAQAATWAASLGELSRHQRRVDVTTAEWRRGCGDREQLIGLAAGPLDERGQVGELRSRLP